jgi:hypothetical protein
MRPIRLFGVFMTLEVLKIGGDWKFVRKEGNNFGKVQTLIVSSMLCEVLHFLFHETAIGEIVLYTD